MTELRCAIGLFVGGRGLRMGGVPKGNLVIGGETVLERLVRVVQDALPNAPLVLVGDASAYTALGLEALADSPAGIGPLGGLRALLLAAREQNLDAALAIACDMPYVGTALVRRLAHETTGAAFLAPREGELWDTLFARYGVGALEAVDATIAAGERALQRVPHRLGERAQALATDDRELAELRDWDEPSDCRD